MTEPLLPPDSHPAHPLPAQRLEYGHTDRTMAPALQWILGILLAMVPVLAAALFQGLIAPFAVGLGAGAGAAAGAGPLLVAGVLFGIGWHLRGGVRYRSMAAGIWTGIALAALIDGICLTIGPASPWRR